MNSAYMRLQSICYRATPRPATPDTSRAFCLFRRFTLTACAARKTELSHYCILFVGCRRLPVRHRGTYTACTRLTAERWAVMSEVCYYPRCRIKPTYFLLYDKVRSISYRSVGLAT